MNAPSLRIAAQPPARGVAAPKKSRQTLVAALRALGIAEGELTIATTLLPRLDADLCEILMARGSLSQEDAARARAEAAGLSAILTPPLPVDADALSRLGSDYCLRNGFLPLKSIGAGIHIAVSRPDQLKPSVRKRLRTFGRLFVSIAPQPYIQAALANVAGKELSASAENMTAAHFSCRNWATPSAAMAGTLLAIGLIGLLFPIATLVAVFAWSVLTLCLLTALRAAAGVAHMWRQPRVADDRLPSIARLPKVSVLVPLFKETVIANRLVKRLEKIDYPRALLEIILITEEDDKATRDHLGQAQLPGWMRVLSVPPGTVKTKPRALNFALPFARGAIIGVYDAEDAPHPEQIHAVVRRFHERPQEVACLQGVLDYYNARTNWLSRCFTIEYATWFRLILPGLERLGLVLPLGGTSLFFRREALERLGAWDAHNVTEDADLGIRLARFGWRTEMIESVTREEANCRAVPWIKQRSRWLKGYALTWAVHMRSPVRLWRELGAWKFLGVQLLFLGTLSQFVLAPVMWSFLLIAFALPHPLANLFPVGVLLALGGLFLATEVISAGISALAVSRTSHRWLLPWIPTLMFYFPMGALASYKGLWEILRRPFYWDKTAHGVSTREEG